MKKLVIFLVLFFLMQSGSGQAILRHQADSLIKLLPSLGTGTAATETSLMLANFYLSKDNQSNADRDSAAFYLSKAKLQSSYLHSPHTHGYTLLTESRLKNASGDPAAGKRLNAQALQLLKKTTDKTLLGKAYYELSRYYTNLDDSLQMAIRVSLVDTAVNLLRSSPDKIELAKDLQMLGDLYKVQGNYSKSVKTLKLSLAVYKSINYKSLQGVYILMDEDNVFLSNYQEALYFGLLAEKCCLETKDNSMQLCQVENIIATTYCYLLQEDEAIPHYLKALTVAKRFRDTAAIYLLTEDMCGVYLYKGKPRLLINLLNEISAKYSKNGAYAKTWTSKNSYLRAYMLLDDYKMSTIYYESVKSELNNPQVQESRKTDIYMDLILYDIKYHKYAQAYRYWNSYSAIANIRHNDYERTRSYQLRYRLDSCTNQFKSAFHYSVRFKELTDSIFNEKKNHQLQELKVAYETREKDVSIELLNQTAKLREAELSRTRRTKNESIVGICILLVVGGLFVRQYRIKQKAYQIISDQNEVIITKNEEIVYKNRALEGLVQEKEYLLMEIHHRVKNNLHTVLSFLTLQSKYLTGEALEAIKVSRQRIYAMSLIHQKLYLAEDVKTIDIQSYLHEFIAYFRECLDPGNNIKFILDIEAVRLPVTKAIPVGLIVNEAVTNSVKYAFPIRKDGVISLTLQRKNDLIELIIADDGIGISLDVNNTDFNSLGIKLIKGLCNDLDGQIIFESAVGTKIMILFKAEIPEQDITTS